MNSNTQISNRPKASSAKALNVKTENLYEFDGVRGYSLGQGQ